ncbi:FAD-dependent oxidoreductase [Paenibacillus rhizoplanae]
MPVNRPVRCGPWNGAGASWSSPEGRTTRPDKASVRSAIMRIWRSLQENYWASAAFPFRWSTQDLITLDRVPYIGKRAEDEEIYIATGFGKWGMTTGTLAARMIADSIQGSSNPYTGLYDSSRFKAVPAIKNFVVQNLSVAKELVSGKVEIVHKKRRRIWNRIRAPWSFTTVNALAPTAIPKANCI